MNKAERRYIRNIKMLLPVKSKIERDLLSSIKSRILEMHEENDNITYEQLEQTIGNPKDIISGYYAMADTDNLIKKLHIAKAIRICACVFVLAVIICTTMIGVFYYHVYTDALSQNVNHTTEITIVDINEKEN